MFKIVHLNYLKQNLNCTKQFPKLLTKFFNTTTTPVANTPATGKEQQITPSIPKTKEQLKVEAQMQQWPEHLRNPKILEMQRLKEYLESVYKFHQGDKKYMGPYDMPATIITQMENKINSPKTTDAIAELFVNYEGFLPDHFIIRKFHEIAVTHRDKAPELYNDILPQVKKLIINCDRHTAQILFYAVESGSLLNLQDKEFWNMLVRIIIKIKKEFKLVNERLYRYLQLEHAARLAFHLVLSGNAPRALLKLLEANFIKHRKALHLDKRLLAFVYQTYSVAGASPTLFAALDDPNIEVPGIDPKIPKMDRLGDDGRQSPATHMLNGEHNNVKKLH